MRRPNDFLDELVARIKENRLGRLPFWLRDVFRLRAQEVPESLLLPTIVPAIDVNGVGVPMTGTVAIPAGAPQQLPDAPGTFQFVQADPNNVDDVLLGVGNGNVPIRLTPGASFGASVPNLSYFFAGSSGLLAVTVNWVSLSPV